MCVIAERLGSLHGLAHAARHGYFSGASTSGRSVSCFSNRSRRKTTIQKKGSDLHPECEGGGDVVGVLTPLVGGVAQAFHDDRVVELRVQLGVQELEGKEEDREGRVEVEEERRLKEVRSWMTMEMFMTRLRS